VRSRREGSGRFGGEKRSLHTGSRHIGDPEDRFDTPPLIHGPESFRKPIRRGINRFASASDRPRDRNDPSITGAPGAPLDAFRLCPS
jgi:hypothetical protein